MKKINDVPIINQIEEGDKRWYSFLKNQMENVEYGAVDVRLTIKSGKVVSVRVSNEKTYNLG